MYDQVIENHAIAYGLDHHFLHALVKMESGCNCYMMKFQPHFQWIKNNEKYAEKFETTEITMKILQASTFGLSQLTGSTALELGLNQLPTALFDPAINLEFCCRHLTKKIEIYGDHPLDLYAAYDIGSVRRASNTYVNHDQVNKFKVFYENQTGKPVKKNNQSGLY